MHPLARHDWRCVGLELALYPSGWAQEELWRWEVAIEGVFESECCLVPWVPPVTSRLQPKHDRIVKLIVLAHVSNRQLDARGAFQIDIVYEIFKSSVVHSIFSSSAWRWGYLSVCQSKGKDTEQQNFNFCASTSVKKQCLLWWVAVQTLIQKWRFH